MSEVPLDVPAHESGRLRLFGIAEMPEGQALRAAAAKEDAAALAEALGAAHLDASRMHLLSVKDIASLGLRGYLAEGYDVPRDQLDAAGDRLDLAPLHLLVVPSSAFEGHAQTLRPASVLRPIAMFDLTDPMPARGPEPTYADPAATLDAPQAEAAGHRRRGSAQFVIGAIALLLLAFVIWALA